MNRTLRADGQAAGGQPRRTADRFRQAHSEERPHEGLGQTVPTSHWQPPRRQMPSHIEEPWYDADYEVRRVGRDGLIGWRLYLTPGGAPAPKVEGEVVKPPRQAAPAPKPGTEAQPPAKPEQTTATPQRSAAVAPRVDPFGAYPRTMEELLDDKPLFSPIEGLEAELWKKPCSTCHQWNRERLCEQGSSYIKAAKYVLRHQHSDGGPCKLALMRWAKSGCL